MELYCVLIGVTTYDRDIMRALVVPADSEKHAKGVAIAEMLDEYPSSQTYYTDVTLIPRKFIYKSLGLPDAED